MKICLVTAFPPSTERINEYGFHLARELRDKPALSVVVLGDTLDDETKPELREFEVQRCWTFNDLLTPLKLLRAIRQCNPDVVWFNLVFSSFGDKPIPAFLGLCTPFLVRLFGWYTHITLHHVLETIDLSKGTRFPAVYKFAGWFATRILLQADFVSVLLPSYRSTLRGKYRARNVQLRKHGVFSATTPPDLDARERQDFRILAFGKWGTYKRIEILIDAFARISAQVPNLRLVIAGSSHPLTPGYVESLRERYRDLPRIEFHGYVPEDEIPRLFSGANVLVLPYESAGGPSGVAHQACEFGLPIVSSDIPDFRDMAEDGGIAMEFYETGNPDSLAKALLALIRDPLKQREMAEQNYMAALQMSMPEVIRQYVHSFARWEQVRDLRRGPRLFQRPRIVDLGKSGIREMQLRTHS